MSEFEDWEERYDGMTGSLFYVSGDQEYYWKPLDSPAPKHTWHRLTDPTGNTVVCYYNINDHSIEDTVGENEVANDMKLHDTFLRECKASGVGRGSIGKCWQALDKNSELVAEKFGWQWRFRRDKNIWYYHDAVFSRYQWAPPDGWSPVRYVRCGEGDSAEFYDLYDRIMITREHEDYASIIDFEVAIGNAESKELLLKYRGTR